jgi:hypothetical protein
LRWLIGLVLLSAILLGRTPAPLAYERGIDVGLVRCLRSQVGSDVSGCILSAVAQERSGAGVAPLKDLPSANNLAQGWSDHMASGGCGGTAPYWDICHNLGGFHMSGSSYSEENVAQGMDCGQGDPYDIIVLWWNSPGHHANLVNATVNTIGVGGAWSAPALFATEDFETFSTAPAPAPVPKPIATTPAPKPVPTTPRPVPTLPKPAPVVTTAPPLSSSTPMASPSPSLIPPSLATPLAEPSPTPTSVAASPRAPAGPSTVLVWCVVAAGVVGLILLIVAMSRTS